MKQTISSSELSPQQNLDSSSVKVESDKFHQSREEAATSLALANQLQVVHAIAGRVRILATDGISMVGSPLLNAISKRLLTQMGVAEATWNEQTQSLVISFDVEVLSLKQMLAIIAEFGIQQQQSNQINTDMFAAWKSDEFWKEQGLDLIPLFTGLAVTGGLGISGLVSIPVYVVTANLTRRAITHLQPLLRQEETGTINKFFQVLVRTHSNQTSQSSIKPSTPKVKTATVNAVTKVEKPTLEPSIENRVNYSLVHAIPGRIRFNVPRIAKDSAYALRLEKLVKTEAEVTSVRVNREAASIAIAYEGSHKSIAYHSSELDVTHWVKLIQWADEIISPIAHNIQTATAQTFTPPEAAPTNSRIQTNNQTKIIKVSSLIADLKSPFLNAFINLMAHLPIKKL